ncbi:MAG: FAD-dependent oxidoreductase [Sphingomonadaceae bacterium]
MVMDSPKTAQMGRRQLLAGAGVLAGASALGGMAAPSRADTPDVASWDMEADIVCVGGGAAGCVAAVSAASLKNRVILLEKRPAIGGTTQMSGGVLWIPNNFLLRKQGIDDKKTDCLRYLARFSYPQTYRSDHPTLGLRESEYRLLEAFYDNGSAMLDRLRELGALDFAQFSFPGADKLPPDYADHLPENKAPRGRALVPYNMDGKASVGEIGDGANIIGHLENWLERNSVPILTEHRASRLLMREGRVIGLEAEHQGKIIRISARKGVIFGTGGYVHNVDLIATHQTALYGSCAGPYAMGDFIEIAGAAGAAMGDLGTAWRTQVVLEDALENRQTISASALPGDSMIMVNKYGRRVVNEKRPYNNRAEIHFVYDPVNMEFPNHLLFMIYDARTADAFGGNHPIPVDPKNVSSVLTGQTLEELTVQIKARLNQLGNRVENVHLSGSFTENLSATIRSFNTSAQSGRDVDFARGDQAYDIDWQAYFSPMREGTKEPVAPYPNPTMHPIRSEGPYYAIILAAGALDTSGGPQINHKAQVMGANGTPIGGLYGAGNCIAAPSRETYYGAGGTIGPAMAFGYIAAVNADSDGAETAGT